MCFTEQGGIRRAKHKLWQELVHEDLECKEKTKQFMAQAPSLRKQFLTEKLQEALHEENLAQATNLRETLRNE